MQSYLIRFYPMSGVSICHLLHHQGIKAQRCCCPNYKGELFEFYVSMDEPWMVKLTNTRTQDYKEWKKTVEQEVKLMLRNKERSALMADQLIGNITFINFHKTPGKL